MPITEATRAAQLIAATKHGAYAGGKEQPEHYVWRSMLARCYTTNRRDYARYGGRGIKVCKRWHDYTKFIADMGPRPSAKHSLERLNNNQGYRPSNCKWATRFEQQSNKRDNRWYEQNGKVDTMAGWARRLGISTPLAWYRINAWGTFERGEHWRPLQ